VPRARRLGAGSGITLIELVCVAAVLAILAALALPIFQNYMVTVRVSEGLVAGGPCRTAVSERYANGNPAEPPGANGWGCEATAPSKLIESVMTDANGVVIVWLSTANELAGARNHTITFTPLTETGADLTAADMPARVAQFRCQSGGFMPIPTKYLPGTCK